MKNWKENWIDFLKLTMDPWNIVLIIISGSLLYCSTHPTNGNGLLSPLLTTILSTVFSGILGSRIHKLWEEATASSIAEAHAKVAIRILQHSLSDILQLKERVKTFLNEANSGKLDQKEINTKYEEIIEKCLSLADSFNVSIKNWIDLAPKTTVESSGMVTNLEMRNNRLEKDIREMELKSAKLSDENERLLQENQKPSLFPPYASSLLNIGNPDTLSYPFELNKSTGKTSSLLDQIKNKK